MFFNKSGGGEMVDAQPYGERLHPSTRCRRFDSCPPHKPKNVLISICRTQDAICFLVSRSTGFAIGAGFGASLFLSVVIYLDYIKVREYFEDAVTIGNPAKIDELKKYDRIKIVMFFNTYVQN